ncbi:MAG TPA: hypothetical protein VGM94_01235 [Galbitalea sp.]|jgi:hypothetical protein
MSNYRVWCLSWEDDELDGIDFADKPSTTGGYIEQILASDKWATDARDAAQMCADHFHSNRDGWESSWPLEFRVRLPDGTTEDYIVEREMVPEFTASRIKGRPSVPPAREPPKSEDKNAA